MIPSLLDPGSGSRFVDAFSIEEMLLIVDVAFMCVVLEEESLFGMILEYSPDRMINTNVLIPTLY